MHCIKYSIGLLVDNVKSFKTVFHLVSEEYFNGAENVKYV